ncbi:MAG: hypothetical protein NT086_11425 [Proteobacteria bacterium]|nr:hypothetical protein [Pseudomonadota bacterium]
MAAELILISRFPLVSQASRLIASSLSDDARTRYLFDLEEQELLQLRSYDGIADFATRTEELNADLQRFSIHMVGDVKRELITYVEAPKPCIHALPDTDFVQLRHVEVPPTKTQAYRKWRTETIFQVVQESAPVEVFLAYHSLISGQPGVMFISGFSGELNDYRAVFESDRYRNIVQQAGDQYITGGTDGLFTRIYIRASLLAA